MTQEECIWSVKFQSQGQRMRDNSKNILKTLNSLIGSLMTGSAGTGLKEVTCLVCVQTGKLRILKITLQETGS